MLTLLPQVTTARRGETHDQFYAVKNMHHSYVVLDQNKDQTYFLHAVHGREINKTLFPVGEIEKPQVRKIAEELDLSHCQEKRLDRDLLYW